MRIHVTELQEGDRLSVGVYSDNDIMILAPGKPLTAFNIDYMIRHQIEYVDIYPRWMLPSQPTLAEMATHWERNAYEPVYKETLRNMKNLFQQAESNGKVAEEDVTGSYDYLVKHIRKEWDVVSLLMQLGGKDQYTYEHSVQVAMLSYYIAKWSGASEEEAYRIGKAGFLHDIGKCRIPAAILNKPARLTKAEFEEIKLHTIYGKKIIEASLSDPWFSIAALQHHERFNGRGYPYGLVPQQIEKVSRIVAIADIYSAMISSRVYQQKRDLYSVLKDIYDMSFKELDPEFSHLFIRHMIPNFLGKAVLLSDGNIGEIVFNHPVELFRPLVRIGKKYVDLSREMAVGIEVVFV